MPALLNWSFDLQICNKQKQKLFDFFGKLSQLFYCFFAYLYFVFDKVIISLYTVIYKPLLNAALSSGCRNDFFIDMVVRIHVFDFANRRLPSAQEICYGFIEI